EYLNEGATAPGSQGGDIRDDVRARVMAELRGHFRPEFLNRIDEIVLFKALTMPEIERIVELMLGELQARLAERQLKLEVTDEARRFIAREGYDPVYGARPLRRFISREVETRIGLALLLPGLTLTTLVLLFGAFALVDGVFTLGHAFTRGRQTGWGLVWMILMGVAGIGAGIVTFFWPGITALALLYVIAAWALVTG